MIQAAERTCRLQIAGDKPLNLCPKTTENNTPQTSFAYCPHGRAYSFRRWRRPSAGWRPGWLHAPRRSCHSDQVPRWSWRCTCCWSSSTIISILKKREYLGHTLNFKIRKRFKEKKSYYADESEWVIFEIPTMQKNGTAARLTQRRRPYKMIDGCKREKLTKQEKQKIEAMRRNFLRYYQQDIIGICITDVRTSIYRTWERPIFSMSCKEYSPFY